MAEQTDTRKNTFRKSLLHNWVEERAVATLDNVDTKIHTQRHGHRGILTMDQGSKMASVTTVKADYVPPRSPGARLRGSRSELMEKHFTRMIRDKVYAESNSRAPEIEFCSTTQKDFCVEGFVPYPPKLSQTHDYKTDQAITFWSENYQQIQGVSAVQTLKAPFRKSTQFSNPISEQLDETEPPPDI